MTPLGPFKIVLEEVAFGSPDQLGNPNADMVSAELARLFNLDEPMARNIVSAMPIIILDGLDARIAGVVRERLLDLMRAGCRVTTTDDPAETIPRVNWPELPAIAQISTEDLPTIKTNAAGGLCCPNCGAGFRLELHGGEGGPASSAPPPPPPAATRASAARGSGLARHESTAATRHASAAPPPPPEDDWMSPPVGTQLTASSPAASPLQRQPFDVQHSPSAAPPAELSPYDFGRPQPLPRPVHTPPPPPPQVQPQQRLHVSFSDSSVQELDLDLDLPEPAPAPAPRRAQSVSESGSMFDQAVDPFDPETPDPFSEEEDPFNASHFDTPVGTRGGIPDDSGSYEATGSLLDSGSDILDLDTPNTTTASNYEEDPFEVASSVGRRPNLESLDDLEDLDLLEDSVDEPPARPAPRPAPRSAPRRSAPAPSRSSFKASDDDMDLLNDSQADGRGVPDLDEVLSMFGPEDELPLDDMSGLEPQPLDLSPDPAVRRRPARGRSADPFDDDMSDILEPLNPSEAMEIIKSQKGRGTRAAGGGPSMEPVDTDEDSLFGDQRQPPKRSSKAKRKKTRGVPFTASDEDLGVFEDKPRTSARKRAVKAEKKKTDPFARARRQLEKEDRSAPRNGRTSKRTAARRSSGRRTSGGPAPKGDGEHGLVLSRISDPDKKEKAAELIAEIKGCSLDSAHRLTDRTIIPVLKGVSREVAEFHLDKFKRYKIAGRVTTRQRS